MSITIIIALLLVTYCCFGAAEVTNNAPFILTLPARRVISNAEGATVGHKIILVHAVDVEGDKPITYEVSAKSSGNFAVKPFEEDGQTKYYLVVASPLQPDTFYNFYVTATDTANNMREGLVYLGTGSAVVPDLPPVE